MILLHKNNRQADINDLAFNYKIELPKLYKLFALLYDLEKGIVFDFYEYNNLKYQINHCIYRQDEEILFNNFLPLEIALTNRNNLEFWQKEELMPIASCGSNSNVLVGLGNSNGDKIYFHDIEMENVQLLANNIFEFCSDLILVDQPLSVLAGIESICELNRNYCDSIWSIKSKEV